MTLKEYIEILKNEVEEKETLEARTTLRSVIKFLEVFEKDSGKTVTQTVSKHCRNCVYDSDTHYICAKGIANGSGITCKYFRIGKC